MCGVYPAQSLSNFSGVHAQCFLAISQYTLNDYNGTSCLIYIPMIEYTLYYIVFSIYYPFTTVIFQVGDLGSDIGFRLYTAGAFT